jgi:hypothetical protein
VPDAKEKGDKREANEVQRDASISESGAGLQDRFLAVPISVLLLGFVLFCYTWRAKLGRQN